MTLNIWTTDLKLCGTENAAGYSSFPYVIPLNNALLDGVVVDYLYLGSNGISSSAGMTAVHEIGHWLGLFHVFEDNNSIQCDESSCYTQGDLICDTDAVPESGLTNIASGQCLGYKCNNGQTSNLTTNVVQNFMDYQTAARFYCQKSFTAGQATRMSDILTFYRASIYNQSINLTTCTTPSPGGISYPYNSSISVQTISYPYPYTEGRIFGARFEVNDKWLVTIDKLNDNSIPGDEPDYIRVYKREGCLYSLHQSFEIPISYSIGTYDETGIYLSNEEIIISCSLTDAVYMYKYNPLTDKWDSNGYQNFRDTSNLSKIGTNVFVVGNFLFILEQSFNSRKKQ